MDCIYDNNFYFIVLILILTKWTYVESWTTHLASWELSFLLFTCELLSIERSIDFSSVSIGLDEDINVITNNLFIIMIV